MLTENDIRRQWAFDKKLNRDKFNHFFFCYRHPENEDLILLGVRLSCAFNGREIRYTSPMLSRVWESDSYEDCDFRPDIRKEILKNIGIAPREHHELYLRCPKALMFKRINFITNQAIDESLGMEEAYWLPR